VRIKCFNLDLHKLPLLFNYTNYGLDVSNQDDLQYFFVFLKVIIFQPIAFKSGKEMRVVTTEYFRKLFKLNVNVNVNVNVIV